PYLLFPVPPPISSTTLHSALSLHDALPILLNPREHHGLDDQFIKKIIRYCVKHDSREEAAIGYDPFQILLQDHNRSPLPRGCHRSEEHTSELQSRFDLVCRLLLDKKKTT